jgi:hypothetical protein
VQPRAIERVDELSEGGVQLLELPRLLVDGFANVPRIERDALEREWRSRLNGACKSDRLIDRGNANAVHPEVRLHVYTDRPVSCRSRSRSRDVVDGSARVECDGEAYIGWDRGQSGRARRADRGIRNQDVPTDLAHHLRLHGRGARDARRASPHLLVSYARRFVRFYMWAERQPV